MRTLIAILLISEVAAAQPTTLAVQGRLRVGVVPAPDATYPIAISLYASEDAAEAAFTESFLAVPVSGGTFSMTLGDANTPLDSAVLSAANAVWVGVTVAGEPELPRAVIREVPFSARATRALTADALSCSGCVAGEMLAAASVTAMHIAPGSVGPEQLSQELQTLAHTDQENTFVAPQTMNAGLDMAGSPTSNFAFENAAVAPVECTAAATGRAYFDTVVGDLMVCNGTEWRGLINSQPLGSPGNPAQSCLDILQAGSAPSSGLYYLKTSSPEPPFQVYCEMELFGGGWTRVGYLHADTKVCAYTGMGTTEDLLSNTGKTGIMAIERAATIGFSKREVLAYVDAASNTIFASSNPNWSWTAIADGTINSWNIHTNNVQASRSGSAFAPLSGPATCSNGPCLLGGYLNGNQWTNIIGIGSHNTGQFVQNTACVTANGAHQGVYSGHPTNSWANSAAIYIR